MNMVKVAKGIIGIITAVGGVILVKENLLDNSGNDNGGSENIETEDTETEITE